MRGKSNGTRKWTEDQRAVAKKAYCLAVTEAVRYVRNHHPTVWENALKEAFLLLGVQPQTVVVMAQSQKVKKSSKDLPVAFLRQKEINRMAKVPPKPGAIPTLDDAISGPPAHMQVFASTTASQIASVLRNQYPVFVVRDEDLKCGRRKGTGECRRFRRFGIHLGLLGNLTVPLPYDSRSRFGCIGCGCDNNHSTISGAITVAGSPAP